MGNVVSYSPRILEEFPTEFFYHNKSLRINGNKTIQKTGSF